MKHTIYWFTGTGNSLTIAREIAEKLGDTDLIQVTRADGAQLEPDSETVGFVFPVYAWGPPKAVAAFLAEVKLKPDTYVYSVCTCGGSASGTQAYVTKRLKKRGITLSGGYVIPMPANYIVWGGAEPDEKQNAKFEKAREKVEEITGNVSEKKTLPIEKGSFLGRLLTRPIYGMLMSQVNKSDKKFMVSDKCTSCRICERICPVDNIELKDGKPTWHHRCQQCLGCLQYCPVEAIDVGKKTIGKKRYHHPDVKAKDLMKVEEGKG